MNFISELFLYLSFDSEKLNRFFKLFLAFGLIPWILSIESLRIFYFFSLHTIIGYKFWVFEFLEGDDPFPYKLGLCSSILSLFSKGFKNFKGRPFFSISSLLLYSFKKCFLKVKFEITEILKLSMKDFRILLWI